MAEYAGKYRWLNLQERKEILEIFKANDEKRIKSNCSEIARNYNVSNTTILRMKKGRRQHWESTMDKEDNSIVFGKRRKASKISILEEVLYEWFKQKRAAGQSITGTQLQEMALSINRKLNINPEFRASKGWLNNFKERYNIRSLTMSAEQLPAKFESCLEFVNAVSSIMLLKNFQLYQIYNADEMGIYWKMLPRINFINEYEESLDGFKMAEERVTVMACANADGRHKIPLFVIGKWENPNSFNDIKLPVEYRYEENAWMTREIFKSWLTTVFLPSVEEFQNKEEKSHNILLILDNAKCHLSKEEIESISDKCVIEFLPPNVTSQIQPMNQGVIQEIKRLYRRNMLKDMLLETSEESLLKYLEKLNILDFCTQIASAWFEVSTENILRAWRKLIPACDIIVETCQVSVDEILQVLYRLPGFHNINVQQVLSWLDVDKNETGWKIQTVDEILQSLSHGNKSSNNEKEQEREEETDSQNIQYSTNIGEIEIKEELEIKEEFDTISETEIIAAEADEALKALNFFKKWYERQWNCESENLIILQRLNNETKDIVAQLKGLNFVENVNE
ncbi:jerky protein homolog-like isoform X1 [Leptopilina boulardi]|uniref:jerky protein homolog-like isoform X1 n=1 Tax=Leptopilina boulardi TaxID=63433 RepID=UPI0021F6858E|nr:jerky protein homolog-like isoform X1 [Leptopilina boulardi]